MRRFVYILLAVACGITVGCNWSEARAERAPAQVVDSLLSREELLRRFRDDVPLVTALEGGSDSRDALVHRFMSTLEKRDTLTLRAMAISQSEFAYLYYPTSPQGLPPYDLEPGLMWHLLLQRSDRGIRRALTTYGGHRFHLVSYDCGDGASREGENTVWGPCVIRGRTDAGRPISLRLFSQIVERGGHYKFVSYANKL